MFGCFVLLLGGITKGSRRMRLLGKFVENECEKIDRLMELYTRYIYSGGKEKKEDCFSFSVTAFPDCILYTWCVGIQTG